MLIVEGETDLAQGLETAFREAGFDVLAATAGREGYALASAGKVDIVLLGIDLPDIQGTEICKMLRSDPRTRAVPLIVTTAKSEEIDRVVAFEIGVDDYMIKPLSTREVILRARAVLRRASHSKCTRAVLRMGPLSIEPETHRVWVNGGEVLLTALEFKLLMTLASNPNRVNRRQNLLSDVWGVSLHVETRTIDTHVKRLRQKLGPAGVFIKTVRSVGYRFVVRAD